MNFEVGVYLFMSGEYEKALRILIGLESMSPQLEVRRDMYLARIMLRLGHYQLAIPFYLTVFERTSLGDVSYTLLSELAYSLLKCKCYKASLKLCNMILDSLEDGQSKNVLGNDVEIMKKTRRIKILNFIHLHRIEDALNLTRLMLVRYEDDRCYAYRAIIEKMNCNIMSCIKSICKAIQLNKKNWRYYYFRAQVYEEIGNTCSSIDDYKKSYKLNPSFINCREKVKKMTDSNYLYNRRKKGENFMKMMIKNESCKKIRKKRGNSKRITLSTMMDFEI